MTCYYLPSVIVSIFKTSPKGLKSWKFNFYIEGYIYLQYTVLCSVIHYLCNRDLYYSILYAVQNESKIFELKNFFKARNSCLALFKALHHLSP